jgi:hypothetical protein
MIEDYFPSKTFSRLIHYWWAFVLLMMLGAGVGLGLTKILHPVYESKAVITSVLDYSVLGKLDDTQEDQIFVGIGQIINSTDVKAEVLNKAKANQVNLSDEVILKSLSADRQDNRWVLYVRTNDAQTAQQLNGYWAASAMQSLQAMKANAVTGYLSQQYVNSLVTCLQESVDLESGSTSCTYKDFSQLQNEIQKVINDPQSQIVSGSLLFLHTSFALTDSPSLPEGPVLLGQNISALAGMLLGLIIGLFIFSTNLIPEPKIKGAL